MDCLTISRFFNSFVRLVLLIFPSAFNCVQPYILPERPASNNSVEHGLVSWLTDFLAASLLCGHEKTGFFSCCSWFICSCFVLFLCLFVFWSWITLKVKSLCRVKVCSKFAGAPSGDLNKSKREKERPICTINSCCDSIWLQLHCEEIQY